MTPTLQHATVLWDFLGAGRQHQACELIVVCGSYDLRVCDYACELLKKASPRICCSPAIPATGRSICGSAPKPIFLRNGPWRLG